MTEATKRLLMSVRQAIIMVLGALEDYLEMRRSIVPRRKRKIVDRAEILADTYENEAIVVSTEELEAIYDDDVFEAMELQEKL